MNRQLVTIDRARGCLMLAAPAGDFAYAHVMSRNQKGRHRTIACLYAPAAEWRVNPPTADDGVLPSTSDFTLHVGSAGVVGLMGQCEADRVQKFIDGFKPAAVAPVVQEVSHVPA